MSWLGGGQEKGRMAKYMKRSLVNLDLGSILSLPHSFPGNRKRVEGGEERFTVHRGSHTNFFVVAEVLSAKLLKLKTAKWRKGCVASMLSGRTQSQWQMTSAVPLRARFKVAISRSSCCSSCTSRRTHRAAPCRICSDDALVTCASAGTCSRSAS